MTGGEKPLWTADGSSGGTGRPGRDPPYEEEPFMGLSCTQRQPLWLWIQSAAHGLFWWFLHFSHPQWNNRKRLRERREAGQEGRGVEGESLLCKHASSVSTDFTPGFYPGPPCSAQGNTVRNHLHGLLTSQRVSESWRPRWPRLLLNLLISLYQDFFLWIMIYYLIMVQWLHTKWVPQGHMLLLIYCLCRLFINNTVDLSCSGFKLYFNLLTLQTRSISRSLQGLRGSPDHQGWIYFGWKHDTSFEI